MSKIAVAAGVAALVSFGSAAIAADQVQKMTSADCQAVWSKADASASGSLSMAQAQPYVTNFKSVDANADGKLSSSEFLSGCQKGMVHNSASSGASTGASGSDAATPPAGTQQ